MARTSDLVNMSYDEFNSLDAKKMKAVVRQLSKIANQRITRLERADLDSPALSALERSGGRFTTANKNLNELRAEYGRIRDFMKAETSTIRGYTQFRKNTLEAIGKKVTDMTPKQFEKFWKSYEKLKELAPAVEGAQFKYTTGLNEMFDMTISNDSLTSDELAAKMYDQLPEDYKRSKEKDEYDGFSEFFDKSEDLPI